MMESRRAMLVDEISRQTRRQTRGVTDAMITELVGRFYARVRHHP